MDEESKKSIIDCANECKGKASMFIFGTNDFGNDRCSEQGCSCSCEISATRGGTCNMVSHTGYRLYKFLDNGKYFLYDTNTNESFIGEKMKVNFHITPCHTLQAARIEMF